ncbi:MAG TPA: glycosyltransferase, partial [Mycobacteriales bacterium]|nr:glycosyltransferase [Mycobacteriales bacterium]
MPDRRVLWVGTQVTDAPRSGGAVRSLRLLEALARHADVDLLTTEESGGALPVDAHARAPRPSKAGVLAGLLRGRPRATARSCPPAAVRAAQRRAAEVDHVVVEWVHLYPLVPRTGPFVLSLHNVEAQRLAELPGAGRDARRLAAAERRLVRDPRATVVCVSERDRDLLGVDAVVVPNGTDLPERASDVPERGTLLFVGAMDYAPNRLAVDWWADEVWPLLPEGTPPLSVAGRNADSLGRRDGVAVLGEVADVAPVLADAALVVVPLRHGGGTRLKVLEAFAANRPVLSTPKGVEGLDVTDGVDCAVADDPAAFAAAVTALLPDLGRRRALAAAARAVAEAHAWGPLGERFARAVLDSPG